MIAIIKGEVYSKSTEHAILEVNGIGYRVFLPATAVQTMQVGEIREIHTYLHVREDALLLYGFLTEKEKEIFTKLLSISGLGPKTALAVISNITTESFLDAVQKSDSDTFAKVPGIGKKTAQRIILELKGKISFDEADATTEKEENNLTIAIEALVGLGYNKNDAKKAIGKEDLAGLTPEEIIKKALKYLAKV